MVEKKTFAFAFLAVFVFMTYYIWANNDSYAQTILGDGFQGILFYYASNPLNLLFIFTLIEINKGSVNHIRNL